MSAHVEQQLLEWQVKEKCGNRIVKVILKRIQVSGSRHNPNKSHETCSSSSQELCLQKQDPSSSFRDTSEFNRGLSLGRNHPQRKKSRTYTHFFDGDGGSDSGDMETIKSNKSGSNSEPNVTSDSEFESSLLNKPRSKLMNSSNKTSHNADRGNKIHKNEDHSSDTKKLFTRDPEPKVACSVCNLHLLNRQVPKHFKRKHPKEKLPTLSYKTFQIECDFCPVKIKNWYMWTHLQRKHPEQVVKGDLGEPRRVKCDLCPSVMLLKELFTHKKTQHPLNKKVTMKNIPKLECDWCSGKYKSPLLLENHILKFHVVDKPFECDICFESFITQELLRKHVKQAHEDKHFNCKYCPTKSFQDSASLKKHIQTFHKSYNDHCDSKSGHSNHVCPACDTLFSTDADLAGHLKKPESKSVMKCELCSDPVYTPCRLSQHLQKRHSDSSKAEAALKREELEAIIESPPATEPMDQSYLSNKIKTSESVESQNQVTPNKFSCIICSTIFSRRCDLDLHELQEKHRRWKCPICAKLVGTKKALKSHIQSVHSDARPFHCTHQGCSKSFKVRKELKNHMAMHDPDQVYCEDCFKYFTNESFPLHVANKHRADQAFKCDICSKTWGSLKRLKQHLLMHTDARPFPCKFCDVKYKSAREANRHTKKCQVRSEDERSKYAQLSRMIVQVAKTRKPRIYYNTGRRRKLTDQTVNLEETAEATPILTNELKSAAASLIRNGTDLKLVKQETGEVTPICTSKSTCATTDLNENETESTLIKQEVDVKYFGSKSSELVGQPATGPELSLIKFELVPKQEMCSYLD